MSTTSPYWKSLREGHGAQLYRLLLAGDLAGLEALLRSFFANIPHQWHVRNNIADYEGYYPSVFHAYFMALEMDVRVEDTSANGWLDTALRAGGLVFLFEFKVVESAARGTALAQLKARDYAAKCRHLGDPIHLVGVEFSRETRNLVGFEVAEVRSQSRSPIWSAASVPLPALPRLGACGPLRPAQPPPSAEPPPPSTER